MDEVGRSGGESRATNHNDGQTQQSRRRQLFVVALAFLVFLLPALVLSVVMVRKAMEAEPYVDDLVEEAETFGIEVTPHTMFDVTAPADVERPPGAVEQAALVDKGIAAFNGAPVDGGLFHPVIVWSGVILLTIWALGALVVGFVSSAPSSALALATIGSVAALWFPLIRYRQVIEVVGYYVC